MPSKMGEKWDKFQGSLNKRMSGEKPTAKPSTAPTNASASLFDRAKSAAATIFGDDDEEAKKKKKANQDK